MTIIAKDNGEGYVAGDDLNVVRNVTNVTPADPLIKAWLTIKTSASILDASATVQKIITTASVPGVGQIGQNGGVGTGDGTASMTFTLTAADTALMGTTIAHFYDVQVKTSTGVINTPDRGTVARLVRGYTDAIT